ncbi:hypothetical protein AWB64_04695 [Caballeronia sordidicola]|uniref:Uncharacterized protein n=1 Tax=Caballeronia sordidicola TaxID=196367 RepID=A0A158HID3_CABSO|nr:hypothetical protein AWB64_04695 [Caballeronia sordidicola]
MEIAMNQGNGFEIETRGRKKAGFASQRKPAFYR